MKKSTKRTVKAVVAVVTAMLMFLSSLGQVVMAVYQDSIEDIEVILEAELIEDNFNLSLPTEALNHNTIPVTTTIIPVTTATPTKTTIVTTTTKVTTKAKKTFIFKPETHYVHTKNCYWTECGKIEEITNTKGVEARLCDECCPDIEIINLYEEPEPEIETNYEEYDSSNYTNAFTATFYGTYDRNGSPTGLGTSGAGGGELFSAYSIALNDSQRQSLGLSYGDIVYLSSESCPSLNGQYQIMDCGCGWDVIDIYYYSYAETPDWFYSQGVVQDVVLSY